MMNEKLTACPLCGDQDEKQILKGKDFFLTKEEYAIADCAGCGFRYTNPRPSADSSAHYYKADDYISHGSGERGIISVLYKFARQFTLRSKFKLVKTYSKGKSILDIGCGTGEFLDFCKKQGFICTGVEPSAKARAYAETTFGLDIKPDFLTGIDQSSRFDCITLWHVLEHIYQLGETMKKLSEVLNKDGILIVAVPNSNSHDARYYDKYWAAYDLPRHIYHFSKGKGRKKVRKKVVICIFAHLILNNPNMENFTSYNPTTLHFGRHVLSNLGSTLKMFGTRVLLVYGQSSVKKTGLYSRIYDLLQGDGFEVFEYGGIKPNPVIEDVDAAAKIGREKQVEMVLAVGGGSVIDSAKVIALAIPANHPSWDFFTGAATPKTGLPIITVLTLAATGSEMNAISVISNHKAKYKAPLRSTFSFPKHSFLDPGITMSVPRDYTAFGIADLVAHCMEVWFGAGDCPMSDKLVLSVIREAIEAGPPLLNDLHNYDLRARIMYAATLALNGLTMQGKVSGDWCVHGAGHVLSLLYDVPHGASLTITYPAWMRFFKDQAGSRISLLGSEMFGKKMNADQAIDRIEEFFLSLDCPVRLRDMNLPVTSFDDIVEAMKIAKVNGMNMKLTPQEYPKLVELFY
jgi:alcohol dehydrogenase YqhD (iron-dependent ADH family)/2-polyprenyl-3-methyl-5-hydroxy-6-metoxy-1,4-benzoquinol methylase